MMKNYLLLARMFLMSILTLSATVLTLRSAQQGDFTYEDNGVSIQIIRYTGSGGAVVIPGTIAGKPVTALGGGAFFGIADLTSVSIPDSVTSIVMGAFSACTSLTGIVVDPLNSDHSSLDGVLFNKNQTTLFQYPGGKTGAYVVPNGVTTIGERAFDGCAGLTGVTIPGTVTEIGRWAFSGCAGLTGVTMPASVGLIGEGAFQGCTGLTGVTIPNSVKYIEYDAFSGCTGLTGLTVDPLNLAYSSLEGVLFNKSQTTLIAYPGGKIGSCIIPNSVTSIDYGAFSGCTGLASVTIFNSVTTIGERAFYGCAGLTGVTIPNSVKFIRQTAFSECTGLTNVTIGNGVASIGGSAFEGCTGLNSVSIGKSVTEIGRSTFQRCSGLTSIAVDPINPAYSSLEGVLFNKDQTTLIEFPGGKTGSYVIPNSVTSIGDYVFGDCTGLTSLIIGNGVTSIGFGAFSGCTGLTSLTIPESVTYIGGGAFGFGDRWTYEGAFYGCTGLSSIAVDPLNPAYSSVEGVLFNEDRTTLIWYPGGKIGGYIIPNSVTYIADGAFSGCTGLTSITIPNSVTYIGGVAFYGCTGLRSVYFIGNAPGIDQWPFGPHPPPAFQGANRATVFYRVGMTWGGETYAGRPAVLWVPTDDLDHDGMNNLEEMLAGTDPLDATSLLAFEPGARADALPEEDRSVIPVGQHALYFQSIPATRYEILSTETIGGEWSSVATVSATTSQKRVLVDKPPRAAFYRIHVLPPE